MQPHPALCRALCTAVALATPTARVPAQEPRAPAVAADDRGQIEAAVRHYFRAVDANRGDELRAAFSPTAMMFWATPAGTLAGLTQSSWQRRLDTASAVQPARARRVDWIDVAGDGAGDGAAARLHSEFATHTFDDFVLLLRVAGRWQIVGKMFDRGAAPRAAADRPVSGDAGIDRRAIEAALRAKFAAMDADDSAGLGAVYHPRAMTYTVTSAADGGRLVAVSLAEWQARFAERHRAGGSEPAMRRVDRLDVSGSAAVARLTHDFGDRRVVDYVTLLKVGGAWRIVGLVYVRPS